MSLFVRRPEARAISYQDVWGSGGDVTSSLSQEKALRLVAVYAATRLIADAVASLPLQTYRRRPDGSRERVADAPLVTSPSSFGTRYDWIHRCVVSMDLRVDATGLAVLRAGGVRLPWCKSRVDLRDRQREAEAQRSVDQAGGHGGQTHPRLGDPGAEWNL